MAKITKKYNTPKNIEYKIKELNTNISSKVDKDGTKVLSDINFSEEKDNNLTNLKTEIESARSENGVIYDSINERLNYHYDINYTFPISLLGIKADGDTDETELLRSILNSKDNITYIFPPNRTIITSEPIDVVANGIRIIGNNCLIKQKDNSGALIKMANREFCNYHETGWLSLFGDNNVIDGLQIDVNWHNNIYSDSEGDWGYFPPRTNKHSTLPSSGFAGISISGNNNIITNCKIYNPTWNGISLPNYGVNRVSNNVNFYYKNNIVSYNEILNSPQDGICFIGQDNCQVIYNKIQMNRFHGIHAYLKDKNCIIKHNRLYCDNSIDTTLIFPNEDLSYSEGCIMLGHSLYPDYQVKNIVVEYNTLVNYNEDKNIKQGIMIQSVSHGEDIYIRNNYIHNLHGNGIITDVYNFGDIVIENNSIFNCNRGVVAVFGLNNETYDLLPTFTTDLPNSNIYIYNNNFSNITNTNINFAVDSYTTKEKHEAHCDNCNVYIDNNKNIGAGIKKNTSENKDNFDKTIYTRVNTFTKDDINEKSSITYFSSNASALSGEEDNNYYAIKGKEVEVNICCTTKNYKSSTQIGYLKPALNGKLYIPVVYYLTSDSTKALKQGLFTLDGNKLNFSVGGNETVEECVVYANFKYTMA